jgi:hypothetical protein
MTDYSRIRAWWSHRQALDGRLNGRPAAEILGQTGWTRSVGGANPYLALFARGAIGRQEADNALANLEIHELPSARGCTYIVPASDFALALRVGHGFGNDREMKTARSLGVTDAEIGKLCDAVLNALAKAPLDPEELREHTGGAVRNLEKQAKRRA